MKKSLTLNHRLSVKQQSVKPVYSLASQFKNVSGIKLSILKSFFSYIILVIYSIFFIACPTDIGAQISKSSATNIDFTVTVLGKTYLAPEGRVAISGSKSWDGDGGPSIRNTSRELLSWKKEGYFQRNRDVGQVFMPKKDIHLDALVIRIGPEENAVGAGAPGAELFLQFFEVIGEPVINDNGTPQGTDSKHGFSKNHRCDDFIDGITYKSIHIARGGIFPDLPPTMDKNGNPTGDETSIYQYLRFDLQGKNELVFKGGKRYAFMLGFVEPGPERTFAVGNWNHAKQSAPPSLVDQYDTYHDGWALRREGDGTIPPTMIVGNKQPKDVALLEKLFHESLFKTPPERFELPPASDGYPDVDTYRDLEFYLEVHPDKNSTSNVKAVNFFKTVTDLPEENYGPSRGRLPMSYYKKIIENMDNKTLVKEWANLAIGHFLDDECPLPKNIAGIFRDEKGNDAPPLYRSHEGGDDLMYAMLQVYKTYPDDADAQAYYQKVVAFADLILEYGTDRYGSITSPMIASILTRDSIPKVPENPENPGKGVRIEKRKVYSFDKGKMTSNWTAVGLGNIWYGSDESHKSSWHGADVAQDEKLYDLLYQLSQITGDQKYKNAADASITFWLANCPTETNLFPWGEHSCWNFFTENYDQGWYHARYHEFKGGASLYDKFIELQPRIRKGEFTVMEKFALAHIPTAIGEIKNGNLQGMFVYGRHQPLWTDRASAMKEDGDMMEFGNFPRIAGSFLYSQGFAYNRSFNPAFKDSVLKDMNLIADGLEQQRSMMNTSYYPYMMILDTNGSSRKEVRKSQNDKLGYSAMRTYYVMDQANVKDAIIDKLNTIGQATGEYNPIEVAPYFGPAMVTGIMPENGSSVKSKVTLRWNAAAGASSYNVYLAEGKDSELRLASPGSPLYQGSTSSTSWQLPELKSGKDYYYAIDAVGDKGIRKGEIYRVSTEDLPEPDSIKKEKK